MDTTTTATTQQGPFSCRFGVFVGFSGYDVLLLGQPIDYADTKQDAARLCERFNEAWQRADHRAPYSYRAAIVSGYRAYQVLFLNSVREVHYTESEAEAACAAYNAAHLETYRHLLAAVA